MSVQPYAEPFSRDGDALGFLLCHGFTGNPASLRPWAEHLAAAGHTVRLPRLPGHGTTWQEMNRTGWPEWYAEVSAALGELRSRCDRIVVGGLSMGGALALKLAAEHGAAISGVVLVNPCVLLQDRRLAALPVLRRVSASTGAVGDDIKRAGVTEHAYPRVPLNALHSSLQLYKALRPELGRVTQPLLLFRSAVDHVVPASSSALVLSSVGSADTTEVVLPDSYHVATLDNDAPLILQQSLAFAERLAATVGGGL